MMALHRRERLLAERRAALLARSAQQRAQIVAALGGFQPGLAGAERAFAAGRWLRRHAAWIAVAGAALLLLKRPRGVLRMAGKAWSLWSGLRAIGL